MCKLVCTAGITYDTFWSIILALHCSRLALKSWEFFWVRIITAVYTGKYTKLAVLRWETAKLRPGRQESERFPGFSRIYFPTVFELKDFRICRFLIRSKATCPPENCSNIWDNSFSYTNDEKKGEINRIGAPSYGQQSKLMYKTATS